MTTPSAPPLKLTLPRQLAYACGQAGNLLCDSLIATYLLLLYLPPSRAGEASTSLLPLVALGIPTMLLANVVARGIDTFLDPLVAHWSDRNQSRFGRRRLFMLVGALPLALATAGVFFPPAATSSTWNVVFLSVVLTAYYAFFSVYVGPYLALLPEIAPEKAMNVRLSTMMAAFALGGGLLAINGGGALIGALGESTIAERQTSIQTTVVVLSIVAFVLLAIPVVFVPERRIVRAHDDDGATNTGFLASLKGTLTDSAFVPYVIGTTLFSFGFNIVRSALPYFVTVLMHEDSKSPAPLAVFGVAALAFPVIGVVAARVGKKPVMIAGSLLLGLSLSGFWFVDDVTSGVALLAVGGLGTGVFLAVPNAILSDVCNANTKRTGERREAMFFGAQGFLQKINLGLSTGVLGWLLDQGRSVEDPLGVRLAGPVAGVVLVAAAVAYARYPEARITAELAEPASTTS